MIKAKNINILLISILLGFLSLVQVRSFQGVSEIILRDGESNIFQELKILKEKNGSLRKEITELESTVKKLSDQNSALFTIEEEISKYNKIVGDHPIFGSGIEISIDKNIGAPWIIDLKNELLNAGAEAISLNGIRFTWEYGGLDTLPNGEILFGGQILEPPFVMVALGDQQNILNILELPGGIFDKIEANFNGIVISTEKKEVIQM